jgi:hypothetical protein
MRFLVVGLALWAVGCACGGPPDHGVDPSDGEECVDLDLDGFGENCPAGDDCRDDDPTIGTECPDCEADPDATGCPCTELEPVVCYTGPPETLGVGPCTSGLRECRDGFWGPCAGEVVPQEEIGGADDYDDDCNGLEDDRLCGDQDDCNGECCAEGQVCLGSYCGTPGECADESDCTNDSHCEAEGCVPWGEGETDEECVGDVIEPVPEFEPELQCEWTGGSVWVPPLVVELDDPLDDTWEPELVFSFFGAGFGGSGGVVAISGVDCEERWRTAGPAVHDWSPMAAGDLEGDGHVEFASKKAAGGIVVFDDEGEVKCEGGPTTPFNALPAAFANLDGAGDSEVLIGLYVYDSDCEEIWSDAESLSPWGNVPAIADVDLDGELEVVTGDRIFDGDSGDVEEDFGLANGLPGIADFDKSTPEPEIAVISPDGARIQTIDGDVIFGPYDDLLAGGFGGHWGGPPTVADFDGDGEAEFGAAGPNDYVVFDPDCEDGWARDGNCAGGADGVLWAKGTQDGSSGATGSSVFDFDADGINEVVYGDECFTRIYDGQTGDTRFITPNANGTAYEYPTIADMDGDGGSEIAIPGWGTFGSCGAPDPDTGEDYVAQNPGVHIWQDPLDRWAPSRRMWNQHAYSVTNVLETGAIPDVPENNWSVAGLNNFRVNTRLCPGRIVLRARIANRGTRDAPRGMSVGFYAGGPPELGGVLVCETRTEDEIPPGGTELVVCDWLNPGDEVVDVWVRADNRGVLAECEENNNDGIIPEVHCDIIG